MIVVDTNVVAYFVIPGSRTKDVEALRRDDRDWRVPSLFYHEWLNVVCRHIVAGIFDRDEALKVYRRGVALVKQSAIANESLDLLILNLHVRSGCTSYDCEFIALAESLGCKLATADKHLIASFSEVVRVL